MYKGQVTGKKGKNMSDNDFIIIDEEKETPVTTEGKESSDTEKKEVFQTSTKEEHEDEYRCV